MRGVRESRSEFDDLERRVCGLVKYYALRRTGKAYIALDSTVPLSSQVSREDSTVTLGERYTGQSFRTEFLLE
jgi:hypothetical protein